MRRLILKILYILFVFLIALLLFVRFFDRENVDQTVVMGSARLPIIRLFLPETGDEAATLHGYLDDMSVRSMRGGIVPVSPDREMALRVVTYGEPLDGLAFEVRDITGDNLVEQTAIVDRTETDYGDIDAHFILKDLIAAGTEYMLILRAETAYGTVSYYTRIILTDGSDAAFVSEALAFAQTFHENTFDKAARSEIIPYLESDRSGDNTSFAHVDIHSSYSQITWGELQVLSHDVPAAQIGDIRGDVVTITLTGSVVLLSEEGRRLPYDVTETFRLRRGEKRIYLLNYDRTMRARFAGESVDFETDRIALGIGAEDFPFTESEEGTVIAFSAGGKLFSYDKSANELHVLFSFTDSESADERCAWPNYDYQLLRAEESGDVRFLVAGYMNRGEHEGRVGVALYRYDAAIRQLEELSFLPVDVSPEILRACVRRMSHMDGSDALYLMLGDDVVLVDPARGAVRIIIENAAQTPWFRSASGALFARADGFLGDRITVTQFNTGESDEVTAQRGTRLIPLGFMQEDLVYGVVRDEDVRKDPAGGDVYAMETVCIRDVQGNILENYHSPGNYVVGAQIDGNQIRLQRVILNETTGYYEETTEDQIVNTLEAKTRINRVLTAVTEIWEKTVWIDLKQAVDARSLKVVTPSLILPEDPAGMTLYAGTGRVQGFYVYANDGSVADICAQEADAVSAADGLNAAVVDTNGRYVWEKKGLSAKNQIMSITAAAETQLADGGDSAAFCLRLMLEQRGINRDVREMLADGDSLSGVLDKSLADCRALALTGCELTALLYYVNRDVPVLVSMRDGGAVLLIGFNDTELVIVDPSKNAGERVYKITRSQGIRLFRENGNRFITYYENSPAL